MTTPTCGESSRSTMSFASPSVTITDRSAAKAGCRGSIPSLTPACSAYDNTRSMPSSTILRAASRSRSGRLRTRAPARRYPERGPRLQRGGCRRCAPPARLQWRRGTFRHGRGSKPSSRRRVSSARSLPGRPRPPCPARGRSRASRLVRNPPRPRAHPRVWWSSGSGSGVREPRSRDPREGKDPPHPLRGEFGVGEQSRPVGQHEELGEVDHRTGTLQSPDHPEVRLVAVQVRQEDDTRLVEAGGRLEDKSAKRDCGGQDLLVALNVPGIEGAQGKRRGGGDGVEDAQEGVTVVLPVAPDQLRVVEVVPGIHPYTLRDEAAQLYLAVFVEE